MKEKAGFYKFEGGILHHGTKIYAPGFTLDVAKTHDGLDGWQYFETEAAAKEAFGIEDEGAEEK